MQQSKNYYLACDAWDHSFILFAKKHIICHNRVLSAVKVQKQHLGHGDKQTWRDKDRATFSPQTLCPLIGVQTEKG